MEFDEAVVLYPARPCRNFIAAQCLLAQQRYTELLVRYDDLLAECRPYNNFLCQLYLLVQKACAFAGLGAQAKAQTALHKALAMAGFTCVLYSCAAQARLSVVNSTAMQAQKIIFHRRIFSPPSPAHKKTGFSSTLLIKV